jgi:signal transduction histidine kinase
MRLAEQLRARLHELEVAARELSASRGRLMRAADAERRRLEELIHQGVERELVEIGETLAAAESSVTRNRQRAITELDRVAKQANDTQEALRALARGIFPPLLTDKGVGAALQSHVRKLPGAVVLSGTLDERFDIRAEAAVYFCCVEALRPAIRGPAGAFPVTVELGSENGWVRFAVRNPAGPPVAPGDLQLLVDRVEAVGGSLVVRITDDETEVSGVVPALTLDVDRTNQIPAQTAASRSGSNSDLGT